MLKEIIELPIYELEEELVKKDFFTARFSKKQHCIKIIQLIDIEFELLENKFEYSDSDTKKLIKRLFKILDIKNPIFYFRFIYGNSNITLKRKLKETIESILENYEGYIVAVFNMLISDFLFQKNIFKKDIELEDLEVILKEIKIENGEIIVNEDLLSNYFKTEKEILEIFKIKDEFLTIAKFVSLKEYLNFKYL